MKKLFEYLEEHYSQAPRDYFKVRFWQENYSFEHNFDSITTGNLELQIVIDTGSAKELEEKALQYLRGLNETN